jgi:hypothetical protein
VSSSWSSLNKGTSSCSVLLHMKGTWTVVCVCVCVCVFERGVRRERVLLACMHLKCTSMLKRHA